MHDDWEAHTRILSGRLKEGEVQSGGRRARLIGDGCVGNVGLVEHEDANGVVFGVAIALACSERQGVRHNHTYTQKKRTSTHTHKHTPHQVGARTEPLGVVSNGRGAVVARHDHQTVSTPIVGRRDGAEALWESKVSAMYCTLQECRTHTHTPDSITDPRTLASRVPDLQLHRLAVNLDGADFEVHADRGDVAGGEGVVGEAEQERRLADAAVADQEELEEMIAAGISEQGVDRSRGERTTLDEMHSGEEWERTILPSYAASVVSTGMAVHGVSDPDGGRYSEETEKRTTACEMEKTSRRLNGEGWERNGSASEQAQQQNSTEGNRGGQEASGAREHEAQRAADNKSEPAGQAQGTGERRRRIEEVIRWRGQKHEQRTREGTL